jgi:two-component system phosphate regulon sensor histidine kinase PhoR
MWEDFWRLSGVVLFSLLMGFITHQVAICLVAGLFLYIVWQFRILKHLLVWLQKRGGHAAPELPGIIDDICREIDFMRMRHRQRKDKLYGFLRRFQEATSALPDAVIVLGEYGAIEWANHKATDYLGIRWPQDGGQRIVNLVRHPDLSLFLGSTGGGDADANRSLQMESPINPDQILEFRMAPYGEGQKLLMARDVTSIQRADKMRKDFIANASHELRTPLTVIYGYLESFEDEIDDFPEIQRSQVRQMRRQTERMQRLIEDLLTLSSLETSSVQTDDEMVVVPDLLAGIHQEAQGISGIMEHIFYLDCDQDLLLRGNQREIYSAFSNLVLNAVQHTPEHGTIRLRWYADRDGAHFAVTDNGEGIAPEHIVRITERFYRVDKGRSRDKGGTGLGLAIVKHVMARHGGSLYIESQPGKGSTFRCDFPVHRIAYRSNTASASLGA